VAHQRRSPTLRILILSSTCGVFLNVFQTTIVRAEWYVGAYGGITNPGAFSNATLSSPTLGGGVANARISDLELKSGLVGGVKAGYFFNARPWLGIETDLFTRKPDVKQQTIVGGTTAGTVFAANLPTTSLRLTTWAFNVIIRSPTMGDVFQPYGGMGYALFLANGSQGGSSDTRLTPGFQLVAGARILLAPKWAIFGEFKFSRATIRFGEFRGNYESQLFVLGVMRQFK
jgi:opacity protein-like surface antigen